MARIESWNEVLISLEVVSNLVYLATEVQPNPDQQRQFLTRAQEELIKLSRTIQDLRPEGGS